KVAGPTDEGWIVRLYGPLRPPSTARTRELAERAGVHVDKDDTYINIFPRLEKDLLSKEVQFPGTGISLNLSAFAFLAPCVIFATLVILDFRVKNALGSSTPLTGSWILLEA